MNIGAISETASKMPTDYPAGSAQADAQVERTSSTRSRGNTSSSLKESELKQMVEEMQKHIESMRVNLKFSTYGDHGERIAVAVMNGDTGEIVREIPPKEIQELYARMSELVGMIFNRNA